MNILVTGGLGFIGSHIVDSCINKKHKVFVVDNGSSIVSGYKNPKAEYFKIDITSSKLVNIFKKYNIDCCIHLAAQISVTSSVRNPINDANINILGSLNLIRLCKKYGLKKIIVASTASVYGNPKYLPIDENHPTEPLSPYGLSKLTMEKYLELSGLNYIILRFSNVYGERQTALGKAGVISIFDYAMRNNKDVFIDGDGEQSRDFIYVKDVADIVTYLTIIPNDNEIINVSTNSLCSINQLFQKMSKIYNYNKPAIHRAPRIGNIKESRLDNSKIITMLNYTNFQKLEKGLQNLLEYNNKQSGVMQNA